MIYKIERMATIPSEIDLCVLALVGARIGYRRSAHGESFVSLCRRCDRTDATEMLMRSDLLPPREVWTLIPL
jgi:hypothetical protein